MAIKLDYDPKKRRAVYTFTNGRTLSVGNVSKTKAEAFLAKDAAEFERRDCRMSSIGGRLARVEETSDG